MTMMVHYIGRLKDGVDPADLDAGWRDQVAELSEFRPLDWLTPPPWLTRRSHFQLDWGTMFCLATDADVAALCSRGAPPPERPADPTERQFAVWVEVF